MSRWFRRLFIVMLVSAVLPAVGCRSSSNKKAEAPKPDPNLAMKYLSEGTEQLEDGQYEKAERTLLRALEADSFSGMARNNLGKVYYKQGRYYDAAWQFQHAVKLMPTQPEPRNNLGLVLEETNKLDAAIAEYEEARKLQPTNPQYLGNLVRAHIRKGNRDENTRKLLEELITIETRPDWREWAQRQINVEFQIK